jgi:hypothetical protein
VTDPEQRHDEAVAPGLALDAVARVDQDHREVAVGGARGHVARVLLVAGAIRDDELAVRGRKIAIRDVDGDALLALRTQAVHQQRQVDGAAGRALALAVFSDRGELILVDGLRVVQQPPNQRALAIVDAAGGEQPHQLLALVAREVGLDVLAERIEPLHQK